MQTKFPDNFLWGGAVAANQAEVRTKLDQMEIPYKVPEQGIMIETPAP